MAAPNNFNRGKPFYPLVMNYLIQLIGFKELALRGLTGTPEVEDLLQSMLRRFPLEGEKGVTAEEAVAKLREDLAKAAGPLQLRSEGQDDPISVDIDEIAQELAENSSYLIRSVLPAAGVIFIAASEMAQAEGWRDRGPLWEFLRHCRNAAAHGGRFTFVGKKPLRPARWRHLTITRSLEGMPLFKDDAGIGFLSPGDPIRLLWDLEQAYPHMQA